MMNFKGYLEEETLSNQVEHAATLVVETGFPIEELVKRCADKDPDVVLNEILGTAAALGAGALVGRYAPKAWKWFKGKFGSAVVNFEDAKKDAIEALGRLKANIEQGGNQDYVSFVQNLANQLDKLRSRQVHKPKQAEAPGTAPTPTTPYASGRGMAQAMPS